MTQALLMRRRQQQLHRQHSRCCCNWQPTRGMAWLTRNTMVQPLSPQGSSRQVCTTGTPCPSCGAAALKVQNAMVLLYGPLTRGWLMA